MIAVGIAVHYVLRYTRHRTLHVCDGLECGGSAPARDQHLPITAIAYLISSGLAALTELCWCPGSASPRLPWRMPTSCRQSPQRWWVAQSLFGGRGSVLGTVVGAVLFTTMTNAAVLLGIDPFWEMVLVGLLIALVVYLDNIQKRRQAGV